MNVLLLYPNLYGMNMLPPAIGLFTAILRRNGHNVSLFDTTVYENLASVNSDKQKADNLNARSYDDRLISEGVRRSDPITDFLSHVEEFSPDLIAVSATEDMFPIGMTLLRNLSKEHRPRVVLGGVFATFAPALAYDLSAGFVDYVIKGEGDEVLPELVSRLSSNASLEDLPGIYYVLNGRVIENSLPRPVEMASLPLPDYDLFDESRFYRPMQGRLWRMFPIQTIRGCPYKCAYCNSPSQMDIHNSEGHKFFRKQGADFVREELEHCVTKYGADSFYFWADTFLAWSDSEFNDFCDMYEDFKLPFWIQTRPETVKAKRFERLLDVGLLRVAFGVEHGNEFFREKILHRKVSNESIINSLKIVTDMSIPISVNNIMGFPTETRELVFDTIELNRNFESDGINSYSFVPFHGTPLRKLSEDLGLVKKGVLARSIMAPTLLDMPQFSRSEIEGIRRCFVLYVKMPKSRWSEIRQAECLTPEGDRAFESLKEVCRSEYMHYGDSAKEETVDKISFADEVIADEVKGSVDFERILREHSSKIKEEAGSSSNFKGLKVVSLTEAD